MLQFRVKNIVPPGGQFFYRIEALDCTITDSSMQRLLSRVAEHMRNNSLAVPEKLRDEVEDYICRNIPEGFCFGCDDGRPRARIVTLDIVRNATMSLVKGAERAEPGVVKQRVDICGKCPYNDRRMCPSCLGLISWARRLVGTQAPRDEWLGVCAVDLTALPAKIHVKTVPPNPEYPEHCWVNQG